MSKKANKKTITNEAEACEALGVKSLSDIKENQIDDVIEILPKMDANLADSIIKAIPVSAEALTKLTIAVSKLFDEEKVKEIVGDKETINAYKQILDVIKEKIAKGNLTSEETKEFINKMEEIAGKMADEERRKEEFDKEIQELKVELIITVVIAAVILVIFIVLAVQVPGVILELIVLGFGLIGAVIIFKIFRDKDKRLRMKYKRK